MLKIWIILATAICAVSEEVSHGDALSFKFSKKPTYLRFQFVNGTKVETILKNGYTFGKVGVKYSSVPPTFQIIRVTFDNEGTYAAFDQFDKEISRYTVKVKTKVNQITTYPGKTLSIPLEGIKQDNATLSFINSQKNVNLLKRGVTSTNPDYIYRIRLTNEYISVSNLKVSDTGRYKLTDNRGRLVSVMTMKVHVVEYNKKVLNKKLISLVLLVVPAISCVFCVVKFCRNKSSNTAKAIQPESVPMCQPVADPAKSNVDANPPEVQVPSLYPPPQYSGQAAYPPNPSNAAAYPSEVQVPSLYPPPQCSGQAAYPPNPSNAAAYPPEVQVPSLYPPAQYSGQAAYPPNPNFNPSNPSA